MTPSLYSAVAGGPYGERQLMQVRLQGDEEWLPRTLSVCVTRRAQNRANANIPLMKSAIRNVADAGANLLTPLRTETSASI